MYESDEWVKTFLFCLFFIIAGFLFMYHLHGRTMLDVHVHQLLLYAVFGQALVAFMEVFHRGNIILELLRCTLTILQGSWFWQVHVNQRERMRAEVFVTSLLPNT